MKIINKGVALTSYFFLKLITAHSNTKCNERRQRLTLTVTSRCTEARLALAEGSLLGASILCIIRTDAGNDVAAIVVKAP